jgi:hypothetical protein
MKRYFVTPPVEGGYAWWNVIDSQSKLYWGDDNFPVASFSIHLPNAKKEAHPLCDRLNGKTC